MTNPDRGDNARIQHLYEMPANLKHLLPILRPKAILTGPLATAAAFFQETNSTHPVPAGIPTSALANLRSNGELTDQDSIF